MKLVISASLFQSRNRETFDSNTFAKHLSDSSCTSFNLVIEKLLIPTSHHFNVTGLIYAGFNLVIEKLLIPTDLLKNRCDAGVSVSIS